MGEKRFCGCLGFKGKSAFPAGSFYKPVDAFAGNLLEARAVTNRGVERRNAQRPHSVKIINKAGINFCGQGTDVFNAAADQPITGLSNQLLHFGCTFFFVPAPNVNQAGFLVFSSMVVLVFSGGKAVIVFVSVFVAEDTHINITPFNRFKVDLIRATIPGRQFFKEKNIGYKTTQNSIAYKECLEISANILEFLLNAADKYF